jgi:hypothetical protein
MIAKCPCEHCGSSIEFNAGEIAEDGQAVECPHCGKQTVLNTPSVQSPKFFVWQNEQQQGPFGQEIIQQMISERKITSETLVCPEDGGLDWTPAKELFFPNSGSSWEHWEQATALPATVLKSIAPVIQHSEGERVFFQGAEILVTNARFVVGAKTFAMQGVTSVQGVKRPVDYKAQFVLIMTGGLLTAAGFGDSLWFLIIGLPILALGILGCVAVKASYEVILTTSGGEAIAYSSLDANYIFKIVKALNESIISNSKP